MQGPKVDLQAGSCHIATTNASDNREGDNNAHIIESEMRDSVRWPINRLSYEELKPSDLTTIERLFSSSNDTPLFMKWVMQRSHSGVFQKRLLVISNFRLRILQHRTFKTTLVCNKQYQLLHIQYVQVLQASSTTAATMSIKISICTRVTDGYSHNQEPELLHFDPGVHTESFVKVLQRLFHGLRLAFPEKQIPVVTMPSECQWQEQFGPSEIGAKEALETTCEAMTTAFCAFCDDLGVVYRPSVARRLRECVTQVSCVDFQYCLSFSPGIDGFQQQQQPPTGSFLAELGRISSPFTSFVSSSSSSVSCTQLHEVQALARAIENVHCVETIVVYNLPLGEIGAIALFQSLLSPSSSIQGYSLTNVRLSVRALRILQHIVLQSTIKRRQEQQALRLRRLNLSFNKFTQPMAEELRTILEILPNGLELLQIEQCGLNPRSSACVLRGLKTNPSFSAVLRELNLSGNHLGCEGTKSICTWITGVFALQRLDVSRTNLGTNTFLRALKQNSILHESSLTLLDLSYNRMRRQASIDLGEIVGKTKSLFTLLLRGILPRQLHPQLMFTMAQPSIVKRTHRNMRTLQPRPQPTDGLKEIYLKNILAPLFQNNAQRTPGLIDLSENRLDGHKAEMLAQLIDDSPRAARSSLRLDYAALHDRSSVLLLHSLRSCKMLNSLSLENNGYIPRNAQRKRSQGKDKSNILPSTLEKAAADALTLLLRDRSNAPDETSKRTIYSVAKPVPLKELSLKCEESASVFGSHVTVAAVQALEFNGLLTMLDVSGNECGDSLAAALGAVLPLNSSLQVLFWDGNLTTVAGFAQFYEGLLQNRTLIMVQMPIKDTRRILEERKDPPREKLFNVLGKIFKVTERNQALVRSAKQPQRSHKRTSNPQQGEKPKAGEQHSEAEMTSLATNNKDNVETQSQQLELPDETNNSLEGNFSTHKSDTLQTAQVDAIDLENVALQGEEKCMSSFPSTMSSRYPSTMRAWSRSGTDRDDAMRQSWSQLGSLS